MYQNCCRKCGSTSLYTENKGNNIGLYCSDCGAWIKWLGKDEARAFKHSQEKQSDKKLNYSELREEIHRILCGFFEFEFPIKNDGEFDFEYLEFSTDEILRLIKNRVEHIDKI